MSGGDRTEAATPRRITKMRAQGVVARSTLAGPALSIALGCICVLALAHYIAGWRDSFAAIVVAASNRGTLSVPRTAMALVCDAQLWTIVISAWCANLLGALASPLMCGSLALAPSAILPRFARLSSGGGLQNLLRVENVLAAISAGVAIAAIASIIIPVLWQAIYQMSVAGAMDTQLFVLAQACKRCWLFATCALLLLAACEVVLQRRKYAMKIRMTARELREERAETESRPEAKQRRRAMGARRARVMRIASVKAATAVITNPDHIAIALRYAPPEIDVPIVVARGADLLATIVRSVAHGFGVPVIESPELARMLFRRVDIDDPIPEECYAAVAAIFAWIMRTRGALRRGDEHDA